MFASDVQRSGIRRRCPSMQGVSLQRIIANPNYRTPGRVVLISAPTARE